MSHEQHSISKLPTTWLFVQQLWKKGTSKLHPLWGWPLDSPHKGPVMQKALPWYGITTGGQYWGRCCHKMSSSCCYWIFNQVASWEHQGTSCVTQSQVALQHGTLMSKAGALVFNMKNWNIKTAFHSIRILIIGIRRSWDCLIFVIGISIFLNIFTLKSVMIGKNIISNIKTIFTGIVLPL